MPASALRRPDCLFTSTAAVPDGDAHVGTQVPRAQAQAILVCGADIRIIRTPVRAPRANTIAERWIDTHCAANASTTS
jgi:hypothetical protein